MAIDAAAAAAELLRRREARQSLPAYIGLIAPDTVPAKHHRLLLDRLAAVERGEIRRLMIFMPPGSAKSSYASILFPPWYMGRNPKHSVIGASHAGELAERFGRRVRNLVGSPEYRRIFGFGLSGDSAAAGRWETERGGEYYAVGVDASVTGRRADLGIIDDPVKGRAEADSQTTRNRTWDWYRADFWPRLKPGGRIVVILCMTGDTPVLMSDGTEKLLRYVRPGDVVATYDNGRLSAAKVLNWKAQGPDLVYEIRTKSGITVKANERHPFLVAKDGELLWLRLRDMTVGDEIVRAMPRTGLGKELSVERMGARSQPSARASVCRTITSTGGPQDIGRHPSTRSLGETLTSNIVTASSRPSISACSTLRAGDAPSVESTLTRRSIRQLIGAGSSASITAMRRERSEDSSVMTATTSSEKEKLNECFSWPLGMFEIARDEIVSIEPFGIEDVFDIQIERTENFIANGLVSHNTRWHEDDLAGRLLAEQARGGEQWDVLSLPMVAGADDPLGRAPGETLWPEWFRPEMIAEARRDPRNWSALYQQEPTPESGEFFKADWLRWYDRLPPRDTLRTYGASDYAVTADGGDYTVHGVVGVDPDDNIYVIDWWRAQTAADEWVEAALDLMAYWQPLMWAEEQGQIIRGVGPFLMKRQRERRIYTYRRQYTSASDKPTRAQSIRARAAMGKVLLPRNAPWAADLLAELLRFPAGKNDDQVDVMGLFGRMLDSLVSGTAPIAAEPMRGADQMTMDELWRLGAPQRPQARRI